MPNRLRISFTVPIEDDRPVRRDEILDWYRRRIETISNGAASDFGRSPVEDDEEAMTYGI